MYEEKTFEGRGQAAQYATQRGYQFVSRAGNTEFWRKGADSAELIFTPGEASPYVLMFVPAS